MTTEVVFEHCEDCVKLSNNLGIGKRFCKSCVKYVVCSNCSTKHKKSNPMTVSDSDGKPLCKTCHDHQCTRCGVFAESEDPTEEEFYWVEGDLMCEECCRHYCCSGCCGSCNYTCPVCEAVHDCECGCTIECTRCGEEFEYNGYEMKDRDDNEYFTQAAKEICSDCWDEMHED